MIRVLFPLGLTIRIAACIAIAAGLAGTERLVVAEGGGEDRMARAIQDLGSASFATRQQATDFLWRLGTVADPALRRASTSGDPEIRLRAQSILDRFRYGLFANTDPKTAGLVNRFRDGDVSAQREVMRHLVERGALKTILALAATEENAELRSEWDAHADDVLLSLVPPLLARGEMRPAEELLRAGSQTQEGMRHWAAYLLIVGKLDDEISRHSAAPGNDPDALRRITYELRARGDLEQACETAAKVSPEFFAELLYEARNWQTIARVQDEHIVRERLGADLEALGYAAAYHRLAGNQREFSERIRAIQDLAEHQEGYGWYCAEALLVNGQVDEAVELMVPDSRAAAFHVRCVQQRYREAFELAEIPYPDGLSLAWFRAVARQAVTPTRDSEERFRLAIYAARLLDDLGQTDIAARALDILAEAAMNDRDGRRIRQVLDAECKLKLTESAARHAAVSLAKDTHPYALSVLLPEDPGVARLWWDYFRQHASHLELEERMRLIGGMLKSDLFDRLSDQAANELIASADEKSQAYEKDGRQLWLDALGRTCLQLGYRREARQYYEAAAISSADSALKVGDLWFDDQQWQKAAQWYEKAWQMQPQSALPLYLQGQSQVRGGRESEGRTLIARAKLIPLAGRSRHDLAAGMETRGYAEDAAEQWKLILRTGPFRQWQVHDAAKRNGNVVCSTDPLTAAGCWESMLLSCLSRRMAFIEIQGYIQIPYVIHKARARGLLQIGRAPEAVQEIQVSQRYSPGNTSLAEDLLPALEAAGLYAQADELFNTTFTHLREICHDFPQSARHHNNLAWMSARCNRQLEEALLLSRRAVELEPASAAYIDTLAEVSFRLGKIEDAVSHEQRCLEIEPDNAQYQAQLSRFRKALTEKGTTEE